MKLQHHPQRGTFNPGKCTITAEVGMIRQQIARYEREGCHKISLWRLAEIADILELGLTVCGLLSAHTAGRPVGMR